MRRVARCCGRLGAAAAAAALGLLLVAPQALFGGRPDSLDAQLDVRLAEVGFTGRVESTLETRLGRRSTRGSRTSGGCRGSTRSPA
jgi:hypothetical protein